MKKRNNGTHKIITLLCFTIHHDGNKMYTLRNKTNTGVRSSPRDKKKKRRRRKKKERKKNLSTLSIELSIDYRLVNIQYSFPRATSSYSILIFLFSLFYYPFLCFTRLHDLPRLLFPPFPFFNATFTCTIHRTDNDEH